MSLISSYFILEAVMPHWENCASGCTNLIRGLTGQNGGNCIVMAVTVVFGSSNDMSVTVQIMSHKKNLVDGVDLIQVTNCSFYMKNY